VTEAQRKPQGSSTGTGGSTTRPIEIELKYRLKNVAAGERYLGAHEVAGLRASSPTRTTQLEDRYVDTADGALARAGFAARLRVSPSGTLLTVKSTNRRNGGATHRREELEGPADRTAGPRDWPPSDARSLILEMCGDAPLVELVTIRQLRRRRELRAADSLFELSLDEVDVVARSQIVERFTELEIELVHGDEARLTAVAEVLEKDPGLDTADVSKLETALAAVKAHVRRHGPLPEVAESASRDRSSRTNGRGRVEVAAQEPEAEAPAPPEPEAAPEADGRPEADAWPEPATRRATRRTAARAAKASSRRRAVPAPSEAQPLVVGKTPGVLADDSIAEAGRKVLRFHFARMLAREAGTREGGDPEDLHSMRVATRRMRAAWRVFGDGFRPGRTRRYRRELRAVAARLGAVRDLDVLLEAADAYRADQSATERRAVEPLLSAWRGFREDARLLLLHELDSDAYAAFLEDFRVFVVTEGAASRDVTATQAHRIRDTAPSRIWSAYEGVRAYEAVLRWADVETLHDLRIAAKWLRYTVEFVREALGPETNDLVTRVVALQDHLGMLHDADVGASMARNFLVDRAGNLSSVESEAIGRYLVSRERELARLKQTVGTPWRGLASLAFRRRLGRAVAGL
jgi:CHAD domain-containing protein